MAQSLLPPKSMARSESNHFARGSELKSRVTQVLVFGPIYQGAMLVHVFEPQPFCRAHFASQVSMKIATAITMSFAAGWPTCMRAYGQVQLVGMKKCKNANALIHLR